MASESPGVEQKPHDGDNQDTILVDNGAPGSNFDSLLIAQPKHGPLDYAGLTVPRKIFTAGGPLLDSTTEGCL